MGTMQGFRPHKRALLLRAFNHRLFHHDSVNAWALIIWARRFWHIYCCLFHKVCLVILHPSSRDRWRNSNIDLLHWDEIHYYYYYTLQWNVLSDQKMSLNTGNETMGDSGTKITLGHAWAWHAGIQLGIDMKRTKVLEQIIPPLAEHQWWNGGPDSFGHKQCRSNTGYRKKHGSWCNIPKPHKASFSCLLWPFHQVHNCLWQNSLAEAL